MYDIIPGANKFPFQTGSTRSKTGNAAMTKRAMFPFQIGSIRSSEEIIETETSPSLFSFQTGSIRSPKSKRMRR